jgi:hypothetical protein
VELNSEKKASRKKAGNYDCEFVQKEYANEKIIKMINEKRR